jgi:hypothetical protein
MAGLPFIQTDGGRSAAGFRGQAGDCVCRAIAIATGRTYAEVYDELSSGTCTQRASKRSGKRAASAGHGISTQRKWFKDYMAALGFRWVPTMQIGSGCKVHLTRDELPTGRLVVMLSRHAAAVINGTLHDTHDCSRDGTRCVYGYYVLNACTPASQPTA